jgi:PAS domain S-box-containing protein
MRLLSRYAIYFILVLAIMSFVTWIFNYVVMGYVLLAVAFLLSVGRIAMTHQQIKKLALRLFNDGSQKKTDPIPVAIQLLEKQEGQLINVISAIKKIQEGNLNEDTLSHLDGEAKSAISNLQSNLLSIREQEAKQNWIVKGIANMGEIRKSNSSLEDYAYQITSTLVKYLEANQGAFYMLMQEESSLQLLATYAYGKRKFTDGKVVIDLGNGLVGQSVVEKDLIFMTQVPVDYVKITSGLGEATPRCIVITPLIFREQVFGAIEIASFRIFEKHHLDFIRQISESVASELADIIRQENTAQLLKQSQIQGQELKSQEEELRQNMEEMQATQEEMKRKEKTLLQHMTDLNKVQDQMKLQEGELKDQLQQVLSERKKNQAILEGCVDGVISFGESGRVQFFNRAAEEIFGYKRSSVVGRPITKFLDLDIVDSPGGETEKVLRTSKGVLINIRTEASAQDKDGNEISLLLTSAQFKLEEGIFFTLFAQKISVDLF